MRCWSLSQGDGEVPTVTIRSNFLFCLIKCLFHSTVTAKTQCREWFLTVDCLDGTAGRHDPCFQLIDLQNRILYITYGIEFSTCVTRFSAGVKLAGNYTDIYMHCLQRRHINRWNLFCIQRPRSEPEHSPPVLFQRINSESYSLLSHFNEPQESKFKPIICFWLLLPFSIETTLALGCFLHGNLINQTSGGREAKFLIMVLGSLNVITTDTYATIKARRIIWAQLLHGTDRYSREDTVKTTTPPSILYIGHVQNKALPESN